MGWDGTGVVILCEVDGDLAADAAGGADDEGDGFGGRWGGRHSN